MSLGVLRLGPRANTGAYSLQCRDQGARLVHLRDRQAGFTETLNPLDKSERIAISVTTTTGPVSVPERRKTTTSAVAITVLTAAFALAYYALSMRQQKPTTLAATRLGPISYDIAHFGALWFWANVALDVALGVMSALAMLWTIRLLLARRRGVSTGIAGATGTLAIAFATFGCPTCTIPLAGTLGIGLFASTLPLFGTELKLVAALPLAISLVVIRKRAHRTSCAVGM